jgi:hypothetical protein
VAAENPAGTLVVGPGTPYITPDTLIAAPTGISWSTIPQKAATAEQQYAELTNMCARATADIDTYCNVPLRATLDTESFTGPGDFRLQLQPTGVTRILTSRPPVLMVVSGQVSNSASFPRSYQPIPADQFEVEKPLLGVYGTSAPSASGGGGQGILLGAGWVTWLFGRLSSRLQVTYLNGWPHAGLTAAAGAGSSSLVVDDITGWVGAAGNVYDSGGTQEFVSVSAVTPATAGAITGPGTFTLSSPLVYQHDKGTVVSALPANVMLAAIYLCVSQALTRGATATAVQSISGGSTGGGQQQSKLYRDLALSLVHAYRRVV